MSKKTGAAPVVFLGDYIDRGPDSRGVVVALIQFKKDFPQTVFLRGNHEDLFLKVADRSLEDDYELFLQNGGQATLDSYGDSWHNIPKEHWDFIRETRLYFRLQAEAADPVSGMKSLRDFLFVHAGVKPKVALEKQSKEDLLCIRGTFIRSAHPMGSTIVVHGHTVLENVPGRAPCRIALDSGVYQKGPIKRRGRVMGGKLTCCNVLTREVCQV
ncbi:metallophosphoesterase [Desulfuromonas thiophila]|uniref:metallophosphoesterase n=1 Tax=Desulfuromonas thiophila TaxID=57664 RepID=UPI0024A8006E|nr:metallophosphoesterase [Desulfuromonas thiophila]